MKKISKTIEKKKRILAKRDRKTPTPAQLANMKKAQDARRLLSYENTGRKTVMTPDVLRLLYEAFSIGCSDEEACLYADISESALYEYQKLNIEFEKRKRLLKEKPSLQARQTIVLGLKRTDNARWYLEKKRKTEFGNSVNITTNPNEARNADVVDKLDKLLKRAKDSTKKKTNDKAKATTTNKK